MQQVVRSYLRTLRAARDVCEGCERRRTRESARGFVAVAFLFVLCVRSGEPSGCGCIALGRRARARGPPARSRALFGGAMMFFRDRVARELPQGFGIKDRRRFAGASGIAAHRLPALHTCASGSQKFSIASTLVAARVHPAASRSPATSPAMRCRRSTSTTRVVPGALKVPPQLPRGQARAPQRSPYLRRMARVWRRDARPWRLPDASRSADDLFITVAPLAMRQNVLDVLLHDVLHVVQVVIELSRG